jgi:hypothetical protein
MATYFYLSPFSGTYTYTYNLYIALPPMHRNDYIHGHYTLPLHGQNPSVMNDDYESVETTPPFSSSNDEVENNNMR